MRKAVCLFLLSGVVLLAMRGSSSGLSGHEFQKLSESSRLAYVFGVLDGWANVVEEMIQSIDEQASVQASAIQNTYGHVGWCSTTPTIPMEQALVIVEEYLKDNPTKWYEQMPTTIWDAMYAACK